MIGIRVYNKLTARASVWMKNCDCVRNLQAHLAEGREILAAARAECAKIESECAKIGSEKDVLEQKRDELLAKILEAQSIAKARDIEVRHCQLLAGWLRHQGGYLIDDLVREIPKFHLAEIERQKERALPEFAGARIKAEVANGLRATLTRSIN